MAPNGKISNNTFSVYTEDDKIYGRFEYDEEDFIGNLYNQSMSLTIGNYTFRLLDVPIKNIDSEFNDSDVKMFALRKLIKKAPPKNMTLSEIEKALGYSVNIITEDERKEIKDK